MTDGTVSSLDVEKLRKVWALAAGGATDGECAAAKARAQVMAARAGLTLKQALSKLDTPKPSKPASFFEGFEDWMEGKEPGYKAKRAREDAERQDRYAKRRAEILKEFGTVRAFMDPTPLEALLLKAGLPFVTKRSSFEDVCGKRRSYAVDFAGISGSYFQLKNVDPKAIEAIKAAIPFPETVSSAFEELRKWDKLNTDRAHFYDHHEYHYDLPIELRVELIRDVVRNKPVSCWDDLEARFHYKAYDWQQQWIDEKSFHDPEWSRLFDDFRVLRSEAEAVVQANVQNGHSYAGENVADAEPSSHAAANDVSPSDAFVQNGRRTNADKATAVVALLRSNPEFTDREIARRAGVSPQTANNWRARLRAEV